MRLLKLIEILNLERVTYGAIAEPLHNITALLQEIDPELAIIKWLQNFATHEGFITPKHARELFAKLFSLRESLKLIEGFTYLVEVEGESDSFVVDVIAKQLPLELLDLSCVLVSIFSKEGVEKV